MKHRFRNFIATLAAASSTVLALGDTVSVRPKDAPPTAAPTVYTDVKVDSIDNGNISFTTTAGNQVVKDFSTVTDIQIDDEPDFNQAENDYLDNHFEHAVDEFNQVIQKTDKAWLKAFCLPRLTDAANKAGRFDLAVPGYIALVMNDPSQAMQYRPALPPDGSQSLDGAATALQTAADAPNIKPEQSAAILSLLLDVQRARKDNTAVAAVAIRLGKTAELANDPNAALAAAALADAKLGEARDDLAAKKFDQAAAAVNGSRNLFLDTDRQAEALFFLAQARQGQASAQNDPQAWRDAAIAYLRVAADFKNAAGAPHVADSLLAAAQILEKLGAPAKAVEMYQSVLRDYAGSPAAQQCKERLERLGAAAN